MRLINFPSFADPNGVLTVFEANAVVPFAIRRVFTVTAACGAKRGEHAHIRCSQLIVCVSGRIRLSCFDGEKREDAILADGSTGVLIPPGTWAVQEYLQDDSTIMVFCDRDYEVEDYIRDYQKFLDMKWAARK